MTMRRVVQKDSSGCGIACAAMLGGVTYLRARKKAVELGLVPDGDGDYYTESWQLRTLLSELGVNSKRGRKVGQWSSIKSASIVGINYRAPNGQDPAWHWVIFVPTEAGGYVLDPLKRIRSARRTDFGRMHPFRYIPTR